MRAIFIDAVNRKVEEVQIENNLHAFYDKIGCELIEVLNIGGNHLALVDEEGKLNDWKVGFRFPKGESLAGNALIVGDDGESDFTDATVPVELFLMIVQFLDLTKTPLPPPACGIAIIHELTPQGIAEARAEALKDLERHR